MEQVEQHSNTTLVKVKSNPMARIVAGALGIQIQLLLKLNYRACKINLSANVFKYNSC